MAKLLHNISIESTPSGAIMPIWLQDVICQAEHRNLLILYPNESSRQSKLNQLSKMNSSIDSSRHLTIKRLIRALLTDLRQPNVIDDDSVLLFETHSRCVSNSRTLSSSMTFGCRKSVSNALINRFIVKCLDESIDEFILDN